MTMQIGLIGAGSIAKHLQGRLEKMGHRISFCLRRNVYEIDGIPYDRKNRTLGELLGEGSVQIPDVVFLAISTLDKGEIARDYITECARVGARVITCEKGSLSYHAAQLGPYFRTSETGLFPAQLAFEATVTGGAQALTYLRSRHLNQRRTTIQTVLNGTCNFIFDMASRGGRTLGEACQEVIRLGYAEPGANDVLTLINGEMRDVVMKTCVLFNTVLAKENFLTPDMIGDFQLTDTQLEELSEEAGHYRLVVSFSNHSAQEFSHFEGGFAVEIDGWHVQGGYRNLDREKELYSWLPSSVGNAVHIVEGKYGAGGMYTLAGPGAGHEATTTAMLNDFLNK